MTSALVVSCCAPDASALALDLEAAGIHVLGAVQWGNLVHEATSAAPDVIVAHEPCPDEALFACVEQLCANAPRPFVLFTTDPDVERMARGIAAGISAYEVNGYAANRLRAVVHLAQVRFRREQKARDDLDALSHRFEERKLLDRAKGLLMRAQQLPEDEAFRLLRAASMQSNRRVGQVSQRVIDAARCAEAVNRAGQLRMLSQRLVMLYALAAQPAAGEYADALSEARTRVGLNLSVLGRTLSRATYGDLVAGVVAPWRPLELALAAEPQAARLREVDQLAERMLACADRLTVNLEVTGATANLHVINVSGRQRMLSQRVAKQAVLGALLPPAAAQAAAAQGALAAAAFERALGQLEALPLSTPAIRDSLSCARACWQVLANAVPHVGEPAGRQAIAEAAEALLARFELLTQQYEHSMQLLMG